MSDKRTVSTTSVTVPNGSLTFKVTAVFVPTYTDGKSYWSKEFTFNINYENSTAFSTVHGSGFSFNDTIIRAIQKKLNTDATGDATE